MDYVAIVNTDYLEQEWIVLTLMGGIFAAVLFTAMFPLVLDVSPNFWWLTIPLAGLVFLAILGVQLHQQSKDNFHEAMAAEGFDNVLYAGDDTFTANHDGEYFTGLLTQVGDSGYDYYIIQLPNE